MTVRLVGTGFAGELGADGGADDPPSPLAPPQAAIVSTNKTEIGAERRFARFATGLFDLLIVVVMGDAYLLTALS